MSNIYEKDTYINPNIFYTFNTDIMEYDIKRAGINIAREYNIIDNDTYNKLINMPKDDSNKALGRIQIDNADFINRLKLAFIDTRKRFFELNQLDDSDIISIKKDAIFITKPCAITNIGNFIEFRIKNTYTSYIRLDKNIELYYNSDHIDVKGINSNKLKLHENYMLDLFNKFFIKMETDTPEDVISYMRRFIDKYKRKELDSGYYRRFDSVSDFDVNLPEGEYIFNADIHKEYIDIQYNLNKVLIKLIKIPI